MVKLYDGGAYLVDGYQIVEDGPDASKAIASMVGEDRVLSKEEAKKNTIAGTHISVSTRYFFRL